jgi:DNA-binding response OmpR family regulator
MDIQNTKILVVDDEPIIRKSLDRTLTGAGYKCRQASNGREALALLHDVVFDLVLLDIGMPGMSGVELLQQVRINWPDTWVMMLTAITDTSTAVQCMKLGATDYLTKPFDCENVLQAVKSILEKREAELLKKERQQRYHEKMRGMIVKENELRAEFLLGVVHEVRTPLTSIIASTELLMEDDNTVSSAQKQNLFDCIAKSSWALNNKITEISDVMDPDQEHLTLEYEPIDVLFLLKEMANQWTVNLERKKQTLDLIAPETLPMVIADGKLFVKIIYNLLSYSSTYSPRMSKIILRASANDTLLNIEVIDTSPPISEEEREFIFQPCYGSQTQEDRPDTAKFGIDLALAKKYAEAHGGGLRVVPGISSGNAFIFSCPIQQKIDKFLL